VSHPADDSAAAKGRRAQLFAAWLVYTYSKEALNAGAGVLDVAGGLEWALTRSLTDAKQRNRTQYPLAAADAHMLDVAVHLLALKEVSDGVTAVCVLLL
jgi:hypothetical protein